MSKLNNKSIIVIDDMKITRKLLIKYLVRFGANQDMIKEAQNGKEAMDLIQEHRFDLIISDWNMPEMTGLELLKFCKGNESFKGIPFILLTSESESNQIAEAFDASVDLYLVKPIQEDDFYKKLMGLIS